MAFKYSYLSHFMDANTPLYGGKVGVIVQPDRSIANGDTANTKLLKLHNHSGTHIDYPNHFFLHGLTSDDYGAEQWIFNNPFLIDIPSDENDIILFTQEQLNKIPRGTDFLMLRTGFERYRGEEKYWKFNPGLAPEMADQLRATFPFLRVIGMDLISITSFQNRELGREAHKNFLKSERPILLVEDMKLSHVAGNPQQLICLPLLIKGIDGSPITILGHFN